MIFPANLLTATKQAAFLTDIGCYRQN